MAATRNDAPLDSNSRSRQKGLNIPFLDEDEFPLAYFTEHRVSKDEFFSDESESSQEDSDDPTSHEDTDKEMGEDVEENDWSEGINRREDVQFQKEVGINVDSENLRSYLDFFLLLFTEE
ncbi:uncharacterized protein LOC111320989 [Stylophora pistillata]|uniref:uncharacterized protein LOC111320989 n=1 Tax=Stylophora pistillata TaxID=50429 RepID=UPI000C053F20|nr:uncharacterized protein LOC111320989 [Stylophora pistillata]